MKTAEKISLVKADAVQKRIEELYGNRDGMVKRQSERFEKLLERFEKDFPESECVALVSAPGRTEIGGNHTDHNQGRVLAAAVNLDTVAAVAPRQDGKVCLNSEGYPPIQLDLQDLSIRGAEKGKTAGLIRGVAAGMTERGYRIGGFNATVTSTVASGSGLSSSAAFEVMVCAIFDKLYNGGTVPFVEQAKISQYAENAYFGKPSGLLDQMASAAGGLVTVDFRADEPDVKAMNYDFATKGYALAVVATGGSHANLTDHYAAIPAEMKAVAAQLGGKVLRDISEAQALENAGMLRKNTGDRAVMRAFHFFRENERVTRQVKALEEDRIGDFLKEITDSGYSSFMYLQNVYAPAGDQSLSLALCLAEEMLKEDGAWRIHGGGFAGTTLNFVPAGKLDRFVNVMENTFGKGCCQVLDIRPEGAAVIEF